MDDEFEDSEYESEPEPEDEGPADEDLVTEDYINFYEKGSTRRGPVLTMKVQALPKAGSTFERAEDAREPIGDEAMWRQLDAYMKSQKFYPSVWLISDHGNPHLLERPKKTAPRKHRS